MGDRCYLHCGVKPEHAERLEELVGGALQPTWNDCGRFKTLICEEFGEGDELEVAAQEGLVFYGYSSAGGSYPARQFASNGDGELYAVTGLWRSGSGFEPMVAVTGTGVLQPEDLYDVQHRLGVYHQVHEIAFPVSKVGKEQDFGAQVEELVHSGMSDEEIFEALGPDSGELLVALARNLMRSLDEEAE